MSQPVVARLFLLLLSFVLHLTVQGTNIEFFDTADPEHARIFQKCRFLNSGDCCVPVDLIFPPPDSRREFFRPYKVVFEYLSKDAVYVFANAQGKAACGGPSVYAYVDPTAQLNVKDFVVRPDQKISGAMFTESKEDVPMGLIRYPWSITFQNVRYYQSRADPLSYVDIYSGRGFRARPQVGLQLPIANNSITES
ncbi:MAG: hypothetical protein L6R35_004298 [Caloplaca aegaea]|nr:MAG: hypothetical protein L6R35_004298 [Caloplaca aegaea]